MKPMKLITSLALLAVVATSALAQSQEKLKVKFYSFADGSAYTMTSFTAPYFKRADFQEFGLTFPVASYGRMTMFAGGAVFYTYPLNFRQKAHTALMVTVAYSFR